MAVMIWSELGVPCVGGQICPIYLQQSKTLRVFAKTSAFLISCSLEIAYCLELERPHDSRVSCRRDTSNIDECY